MTQRPVVYYLDDDAEQRTAFEEALAQGDHGFDGKACAIPLELFAACEKKSPVAIIFDHYLKAGTSDTIHALLKDQGLLEGVACLVFANPSSPATAYARQSFDTRVHSLSASLEFIRTIVNGGE